MSKKAELCVDPAVGLNYKYDWCVGMCVMCTKGTSAKYEVRIEISGTVMLSKTSNGCKAREKAVLAKYSAGNPSLLAKNEYIFVNNSSRLER